MGALIEIFGPLLFGFIVMALSIAYESKKKKQTFVWPDGAFEDFDSEKPHVEGHDLDSRTHRIWEQEQRVTQHSESQNFVRLKDRKESLKKEPIKKPDAAQSNKHHQEPVHLVKKTVFRDKEEVQRAMIFGEIIGTPVSRRKRR